MWEKNVTSWNDNGKRTKYKNTAVTVLCIVSCFLTLQFKINFSPDDEMPKNVGILRNVLLCAWCKQIFYVDVIWFFFLIKNKRHNNPHRFNYIMKLKIRQIQHKTNTLWILSWKWLEKYKRYRIETF